MISLKSSPAGRADDLLANSTDRLSRSADVRLRTLPNVPMVGFSPEFSRIGRSVGLVRRFLQFSRVFIANAPISVPTGIG